MKEKVEPNSAAQMLEKGACDSTENKLMSYTARAMGPTRE
jgi:hypothetical protein